MQKILDALTINELTDLLKHLRKVSRSSVTMGKLQFNSPEFIRVVHDGVFLGQLKTNVDTIELLDDNIRNLSSSMLTKCKPPGDISDDLYIVCQVHEMSQLFEVLWVDASGIYIRDMESNEWIVQPKSIEAMEIADKSSAIPMSTNDGINITDFVKWAGTTRMGITSSLCVIEGIPYFKTAVDGSWFFQHVAGTAKALPTRLTQSD